MCRKWFKACLWEMYWKFIAILMKNFSKRGSKKHQGRGAWTWSGARKWRTWSRPGDLVISYYLLSLRTVIVWLEMIGFMGSLTQPILARRHLLKKRHIKNRNDTFRNIVYQNVYNWSTLLQFGWPVKWNVFNNLRPAMIFWKGCERRKSGFWHRKGCQNIY